MRAPRRLAGSPWPGLWTLADRLRQRDGYPFDLALGHGGEEGQRHRPCRDEVIHALRLRGVQCKPYLPAIHLMSFYRERFGHREGEFPVCEDVAARSVALPFFTTIAEPEVERVATALEAAL